MANHRHAVPSPPTCYNNKLSAQPELKLLLLAVVAVVVAFIAVTAVIAVIAIVAVVACVAVVAVVAAVAVLATLIRHCCKLNRCFGNLLFDVIVQA